MGVRRIRVVGVNRFAIAYVAVVALAAVGIDPGSFAGALKPSLDFAEGLIEVGQYGPAEDILAKIDAATPAEQAELELLRGRLLLARGNPVKALDQFAKAAALSLDREAESYLYMAEAKLALGQVPQARRDAELALKSDPDLVAAELVLAKSERRAGHPKDGANRLAKLIQQRPDDEAVAVVLASYQSESQGRDAAIASLEEFVKVHPDAAAAENALGGLLWMAGEHVESLRARIAAGEQYLSENKIGRAQAMALWIKSVDADGKLERSARGETAQPVVLPPGMQLAPTPEPALKPPVDDEPPPPRAAPLAPPPTTESLPRHDTVTPDAPQADAVQSQPPVAQAAPQPMRVLTPPANAPMPQPEPQSEPQPQPQQQAMAAPAPEPMPESQERPQFVPAAILETPDPLPFPPGSNYTSGTGVVVDNGRLVVTNRHVIEGMRVIYLRNGTGHLRRARLVKVSHEDDLALLEIDQPFPEAASFQCSDLVDPAPGRAAVSLGFPLVDLLGDNLPALTEGIVAKTTGLANDPKTFQITTKINKGNSGGPVFDRAGRLMGVTVGQTDAADIYRRDGYLVEDMNIGIKADRILRFLGRSVPPPTHVRAEMSLEDLYQMMLPRVVLVAAQR